MSIVIFISDSYCIRHCWVSFFLFNKLLGGDKKKRKISFGAALSGDNNNNNKQEK